MPVYTVQDAAIQLSTLYSEPYQIRNSGTETIYIGKDTTVSSSQYDWSLSPGDTLGFTAQTYLYLICEVGKTSTLEQQYGALGNFTPAPSSVVTLSGNVPVKISETVTNFSSGTSGIVAASFSLIDVSDYSSVTVVIGVARTNPADPVITAVVDNYMTVALEFWTLNSNAGSFGSVQPQFLFCEPSSSLGQSPAQSIQLPVRGALLNGNVIITRGAATSAGRVYVTLLGTHETIAQPKYISQGLGFDNGITTSGLAEIVQTAIGNNTVFLSSLNGLYTYGNSKDSPGTNLARIYTLKNGVATQRYFLPNTTAGIASQNILHIALPLLPIFGLVSVFGAPTLSTLTLVKE